MKRNEVPAVLTAIHAFNQWQELGPDFEDGWFDALDKDMDAIWAVKSINAFYGNPDRKHKHVSPSDLNEEWRLRKQQEREEDLWQRQQEVGEPVRTGMPPWFRDAMQEAFGGAGFDAMTPRTGTQEIFDRHAAKAGIDLSQTRSDHSDGHCGKTGCMCTHTRGCYKGWMEGHADAAKPCPVCRTSLSLVLKELPPPGSRTQADHQRIRTRDSDA